MKTVSPAQVQTNPVFQTCEYHVVVSKENALRPRRVAWSMNKLQLNVSNFGDFIVSCFVYVFFFHVAILVKFTGYSLLLGKQTIPAELFRHLAHARTLLQNFRTSAVPLQLRRRVS
jgi:hypothetical protein